MKYALIFLYMLYFCSASEFNTNNNQNITIKEIFQGKSQNDSWEKGKFYEYYIDISNYDLNEENFFEIYGNNTGIKPNNIKLYLLFTDISDKELIKDGTIKPNLEKDIYPLNSNTEYFIIQNLIFIMTKITFSFLSK